MIPTMLIGIDSAVEIGDVADITWMEFMPYGDGGVKDVWRQQVHDRRFAFD